MATYDIKHVTRYRYEYPVSVSHHTAYLEPKQLSVQRVFDYMMETTPACADLRSRIDYFGNRIRFFSIHSEHQELEITSHSRVEVTRQEPQLWSIGATCADARKALAEPGSHLEAYQYLHFSPSAPKPSAEIVAFAEPFFPDEAPLAQAVKDFASHIRKEFEFDPSSTDVDTPVEQVFKQRRGVCQDFAHFMIASLRAMGLAARYVSGYILTTPPPGTPRLEGADASHAWVAVFIPGFGWLDVDPTNDLLCSDQHVTVAWGRDFADVSLVRGAVNGGGDHTIDIAVTMKPVEE